MLRSSERGRLLEENMPGNSWKQKLKETGRRRRRHFPWAFLCSLYTETTEQKKNPTNPKNHTPKPQMPTEVDNAVTGSG